MKYCFHYAVLLTTCCAILGSPAEFWKKFRLAKRHENLTDDAGSHGVELSVSNGTFLDILEALKSHGNASEVTQVNQNDTVKNETAKEEPVKIIVQNTTLLDGLLGPKSGNKNGTEKAGQEITLSKDKPEKKNETNTEHFENSNQEVHFPGMSGIIDGLSKTWNSSHSSLKKFGNFIGHFFEGKHEAGLEGPQSSDDTSLQETKKSEITEESVKRDAQPSKVSGGNSEIIQKVLNNTATQNHTSEAKIVLKPVGNTTGVIPTKVETPSFNKTEPEKVSKHDTIKDHATTTLLQNFSDSVTNKISDIRETLIGNTTEAKAGPENVPHQNDTIKSNSTTTLFKNLLGTVAHKISDIPLNKNLRVQNPVDELIKKGSEKLKSVVGNLTSPEALHKINHIFEALVNKQEGDGTSNAEDQENDSYEENTSEEEQHGKTLIEIKGESEEAPASQDIEELLPTTKPISEVLSKELKAMKSKDYKNKEVCYDFLGCFNTGAPWRTPERPCVVPEDPKKLRTRISQLSGNHSTVIYEDLRVDIDDITFSHNHETYLIVHGLHAAGGSEWVRKLASVLKKKYHGNVLVVDWSGGEAPAVMSACGNMRIVAREMAALARALHKKKGMKISRTHCIGHGFGAHICGLMGKNLTTTDLKLGSITALEAAQFPFEEQPSQVRLSKTDARTVVAHHTQALPTGPGYMGTNIASINFYYNGGVRQPGCPVTDSLEKLEKLAKTVFVSMMFNQVIDYDFQEFKIYPVEIALCSHNRVCDYFIEAISRECDYLGHPFEPKNSIDGIVNGLTNGIFSKWLGSSVNCTSSNDCLQVGLDFSEYPDYGIYEIQTKSKSPFCLRDGDVASREMRREQEMSLYGKFLTMYQKVLKFVLQ